MRLVQLTVAFLAASVCVLPVHARTRMTADQLRLNNPRSDVDGGDVVIYDDVISLYNTAQSEGVDLTFSTDNVSFTTIGGADLTLTGDGAGRVRVNETGLHLGRDVNENLRFYALNGDANSPYVGYDAATSAWVVSDDGLTESPLGGFTGDVQGVSLGYITDTIGTLSLRAASNESIELRLGDDAAVSKVSIVNSSLVEVALIDSEGHATLAVSDETSPSLMFGDANYGMYRDAVSNDLVILYNDTVGVSYSAASFTHSTNSFHIGKNLDAFDIDLAFDTGTVTEPTIRWDYSAQELVWSNDGVTFSSFGGFDGNLRGNELTDLTQTTTIHANSSYPNIDLRVGDTLGSGKILFDHNNGANFLDIYNTGADTYIEQTSAGWDLIIRATDAGDQVIIDDELEVSGDLTLAAGGVIDSTSNGDINIDPNGTGTVNVSDTQLGIGEGADVDIRLYAHNGDVNSPYIGYDSGTSAWVVSDDGLTESALTPFTGDLSAVSLGLLTDTSGTLTLQADTTRDIYLKMGDAGASNAVYFVQSSGGSVTKIDSLGRLTFLSNGSILTAGNHDLRLIPDGTGEITFEKTLFRLGAGADVDHFMYVDNGDTFQPYLAYNSAGSQWVWSDDGQTETAFASISGGGGATIETFQLPVTGDALIVRSPAAELSTLTGATNGVSMRSLAFDDSTDEFAHWQINMPSNLDTTSSVTITITWIPATASSNDVVWAVNHEAFGDGESFDSGYATATVTSAGSASTDFVTVATIVDTVTNLGWAPDDHVILQPFRNADAGADTLTGDAHLLGISVTIPVN